MPPRMPIVGREEGMDTKKELSEEARRGQNIAHVRCRYLYEARR